MRVLVTGGAGFIGSHIVDGLLSSHDELEVVVWDTLVTGSVENLPAHERLTFRTFDVAHPEKWDDEEKLDSGHFQCIIHCAARTKVVESETRQNEYVAANVTGVLALTHRFPNAQHLLLSTAGAMHSNEQFENGAVVETTSPPQPPSIYGKTKLLAEQVIRSLPRGVVVRLTNVFGPRQLPTHEGGVVSIFLDRAARGRVLNIYGTGNQTRDFIFVGDVASFVVLLVTSGMVAWQDRVTTVVLCQGESTSVNELVAAISSAEPVDTDYLKSRSVEVEHMQFAPCPLARNYGWKRTEKVTHYMKQRSERRAESGGEK